MKKAMCTAIIFIGIILTIIGIVLFWNAFNDKSKIETKGEITKISPFINENGVTNYEVYIWYTVDGTDYESKLITFYNNLYVDKHLEIYYYKDDIKKIELKSFNISNLILPGIGILLLILGDIGLHKAINSETY